MANTCHIHNCFCYYIAVVVDLTLSKVDHSVLTNFMNEGEGAAGIDVSDNHVGFRSDGVVELVCCSAIVPPFRTGIVMNFKRMVFVLFFEFIKFQERYWQKTSIKNIGYHMLKAFTSPRMST